MNALLFLLLVPLAVLVSRLWRMGRRERGLPPGPPTTFILGNAGIFPKEFPHLQFTRWAAEYGEIFSLKLLNQTTIVLSSASAIKDVLDRQGLATGDRPQSYMIRRTEGIYPVLDNMDTRVWKASRKAYHAFLTNEALARYWPMQQVEYLQFLNDILDSPDDLFTHIKRTTASVMTYLVYGKRASQYQGSKAELFYEGVKRLTQVTDPFAHPPMDMFPILKYVPTRWAKWKTLCDDTRALRDEFDHDLFADCEKALREGNRSGCYIENVLENQSKFGMTREEIKAMGKVLMDGGTETSASYLQSFILALVCNPECQKKAQEEIDRVIGDDRMPSLEDYEDLTYVKAFVKEVHRFRTVFPIAIPHVAAQDVRYKDYLIPEGSVIFMNTYGAFRDPQLYEHPDSFMPERYLQSEYGTKLGADTDGLRETLHFGSGRRICPGAEMASRTISMNAMNLIWAFNFTKHKSGTCTMDYENYVKPGLELAPKPFACNVKARNAKRAALIVESYANAAL